jgi:hypothetical protein
MEFNYSPIERNRYFYGKLLTVRDFNTEQEYNALKRRLINRLVVGAGVVCGLGVSASDDATLTIESGMALDYLGREIVVEKALIRRLEMLEGYGELAGRDCAYLCLCYDETQEEPVNAAGSSSDNRECNRIRETHRLYLSPQPPDYKTLLGARSGGSGNVSVLYASDELTIVLYTPAAVQAGGSFEMTALVVKNDKTLPVRFTLEWENGFIDNEGKRLITEYTDSANTVRNVTEVKFRYTVRDIADLAAQLFPSGLELNVEIGSRSYKNFLQPDAGVYVCGTPERYEEYVRISDSLDSHTSGGEMPIYLAKLELVGVSDRIFLGTVTDLPFGQQLRRGGEAETKEREGIQVTTSVKTLEYWQSPAVRAVSDGGSLHLEFSLPKPENYDYRTSHGYVDVAMPGGIKVNSKYYSDEVAHGLGPGNVNVRLAIEFTGGTGGNAMIFGNTDVFRSKHSEVDPPWAEAAAVIYPEKGTMRIGVWTHDTVDGNSLRVHYFADKPDRDTRPLIDEPHISVEITPEIARVERRGKLQFEASVKGGADKAVIWSVKGDDFGSVDENGVYQAPESRGTYEITARCRADESISASAFVIVE